MSRLVSIVLALLLVPTLVLASPGGFRCQDGILRPKCCCPKKHDDTPLRPDCPSLRKPQCCDVVAATATLVQPAASEEQRQRDLHAARTVTVIWLEAPREADTKRWSSPPEKKSSESNLFLRNRTLLI